MGLVGSCLMLHSQPLPQLQPESNSHFRWDNSDNKGISLGERNKFDADSEWMTSHNLPDEAFDTKTEKAKVQKATRASDIITVGDLKYTILSDTEVAVSGHTYGTVVVIPSLVIPGTITYSGKTYTVTSIGDLAFYKAGLQSLTIPSTVKTIGAYAFGYCDWLKSVSIPNSVTSIGKYAFSDCKALQSIAIPSSATSIDAGAFENCSSLESISVAESNANYCSVDGVLYSKDKTQLIAYPGGKEGGFSVPETVTSIGDQAFWNCDKLTNISFPNSLTSIGADAFLFCDGLTSIVIPNSVTSIGSYAFYKCVNLESVSLSNSITTLEKSVFYGNEKLLSVKLPASLVSIGNYAFYNCNSLISIEIPNSATSIGDGAFYICTSLNSISVPASVTYIGNEALCGLKSTTAINVDASNPNYCSVDGVLYNKDKTLLCAYPSGKQGEFAIPETVTTVGESAFIYAENLTKITIPNSVNAIGNYAFSGCSGLTSVVLPKSITSIGKSTFHSCKNLKSIFIPNYVTSIGDYAFQGCSNLTAILIPKKVATIGNSPFYGCDNLNKVYLLYTASSPSSSMTYQQLVSKFPNYSAFYIPRGANYSLYNYAGFNGCEFYLDDPFIHYEGYKQGSNEDIVLKGDTKQLICDSRPELMVVDDMTWSSSNNDIATIDKNGLITAHSPGDFDITVGVKAGDDIYTTTKSFKVRLATFEIGKTIGRVTKPGNISVALNNSVPMTSFQCDIKLPKEYEPVLNSAGNPIVKLNATRKSRTHSIVSSLHEGNVVRVSATSTTNANFVGESGELFTLQVMPKTTQLDEYYVYLYNIIASDRDMNSIKIEDNDSRVGFSLKPGDANIDELVDVSDVSATVSYIHGRGAEQFDFASADVKQDYRIDVIDVTGIVNIILDSGLSLNTPAADTGSAEYAPMLAAETSTAGFYIKNENFEQGKEGLLQVCCDKITNFSSFQTDIYLPEGVEILTYNEGDGDFPDVMLDADCDSGSHSIAAKVQKDGALRVVCSSMDNSLLLNSSGNVVFTVRIKPAAGMQAKEYPVQFRNTVFDTDGHNAVRINENSSTLRIGITTGVNDIQSEAVCGNAVYYNLQGAPVAQPEAGVVYIKVVNGVASKVMIK